MLLLCLSYAFVMLLLCLSYTSVMLLLCCFWFFIVLLLCFYWNKIFTQSVSSLFFYSHFLKEEYVSKKLFIKAMVCSKKRKSIDMSPMVCVSIHGWVKCKRLRLSWARLRPKKVTPPRARSRSVLQAKLLELEIKALLKDANVDVLIANTPKGEQNRNPTKKSFN